MTLLSIALGGAVGSVARWLLGLALQRLTPGFPVGTLLVNVTGSFALGVVARAVWLDASPVLRAGLAIGVCGGFTTFSTFSLEMLTLLERGFPGRAALYAMLSVLLSLAAVAAGVHLTGTGYPAPGTR
jgi:CrcB protein